MKRLFDKIYFSSELLSDKVLVGGNNKNLLKFLIADTISATEIDQVELKLQAPSTERGGLPTLVLDWEILTKDTDNINIFEKEITFTETESITDIEGVIKITDTKGNVFYNHYKPFELKVL